MRGTWKALLNHRHIFENLVPDVEEFAERCQAMPWHHTLPIYTFLDSQGGVAERTGGAGSQLIHR